MKILIPFFLVGLTALLVGAIAGSSEAPVSQSEFRAYQQTMQAHEEVRDKVLEQIAIALESLETRKVDKEAPTDEFIP